MSTLKVSNINNASASSGGVSIDADGKTTITSLDVTDAISGALPYPNRNLLYNGAMQVHQRGTSTTGITAASYNTADRWQFVPSSMGTWTQTVETDAPTGSGFRKSLKVLCTTADAAPAAGDLIIFQQLLEGQDLQRVAKGTSSAKQITVSFWTKSNNAGTYVLRLADSDNSRSVSAQYSISATNTWEKKTITFPADTTGAFDNDNAVSLRVQFWLGAGSDYTSGTLASVWATDVLANIAVGQTNLAAATNNYWQITGVQLVVGPSATEFEFKSFGQELQECQRYYQKSYNADVNPGTVTNVGAVVYDNVGGGTRTMMYLTKNMRAAPTVTFYNPVSGSAGSTRNTSTNANVNTAAAIFVGERSIGFDSGVIASGNIGSVHYVAEVEL